MSTGVTPGVTAVVTPAVAGVSGGISDGGPVERYERLLERPVDEVMGEVCARVVEGDSLRAVARDWGLPVARFMVWVMGDDDRRGMYEGALRLRADELVHESLADIRIDELGSHKLKVAGLWDRKRFGRGEGGSIGLKVVVQRFSEGAVGVAGQSLDGTSVAVETSGAGD